MAQTPDINISGLFSTECIACAVSQSIRCARLCNATRADEEQIVAKVLDRCKAEDWSEKGCTSRMIADLYRITGEHLEIADPFLDAKIKSNKFAAGMAKKLAVDIAAEHEDAKSRLYHTIRMAVIGNYIDFGTALFRGLDQLEHLIGDTELRHSDYDALWTDLSHASSLLYLLDNSGEVYLDMHAIERIAEVFPNIRKITIGLKNGPLINDVTMGDVVDLGLDTARFNGIKPELVGFGTETSGAWPAVTDESVTELFDAHDVVISKGQGNFEALGPFGLGAYFMLVIKCPIVADMIHEKARVGDGVLVFK